MSSLSFGEADRGGLQEIQRWVNLMIRIIKGLFLLFF